MAAPEDDPPVRKSVSVPQSTCDEIVNLRISERIGTEAEAIRRLIQSGLRAEARKAKKK
jgi:hypothetical protein